MFEFLSETLKCPSNNSLGSMFSLFFFDGLTIKNKWQIKPFVQMLYFTMLKWILNNFHFWWNKYQINLNLKHWLGRFILTQKTQNQAKLLTVKQLGVIRDCHLHFIDYVTYILLMKKMLLKISSYVDFPDYHIILSKGQANELFQDTAIFSYLFPEEILFAFSMQFHTRT